MKGRLDDGLGGITTNLWNLSVIALPVGWVVATSVWNALQAGHAWPYAHVAAGRRRLMAWGVVVTSACGLVWAYVVCLGGLAAALGLVPYDFPALIAGIGLYVALLALLGSLVALRLRRWAFIARKDVVASFKAAPHHEFSSMRMNIQILSRWAKLDSLSADWGGIRLALSGKKKGTFIVVLVIVTLGSIAGVLTTWALVRSRARSESDKLVAAYRALRPDEIPGASGKAWVADEFRGGLKS